MDRDGSLHQLAAEFPMMDLVLDTNMNISEIRCPTKRREEVKGFSRLVGHMSAEGGLNFLIVALISA